MATVGNYIVPTKKLISAWLRSVFVALILLFVATPAFAQLDNTESPFTNPKHSGTAEQVQVIGLNDAGKDDGGQEDALINVVRGGINRLLGILALIALIVLLRGGFQMVTAAGNEDKYNAGFTILKQAAVGLAIIGLARFIVSIIFFVINLTTKEAEGTSGNTI